MPANALPAAAVAAVGFGYGVLLISMTPWPVVPTLAGAIGGACVGAIAELWLPDA